MLIQLIKNNLSTPSPCKFHLYCSVHCICTNLCGDSGMSISSSLLGTDLHSSSPQVFFSSPMARKKSISYVSRIRLNYLISGSQLVWIITLLVWNRFLPVSPLAMNSIVTCCSSTVFGTVIFWMNWLPCYHSGLDVI